MVIGLLLKLYKSTVARKKMHTSMVRNSETFFKDDAVTNLADPCGNHFFVRPTVRNETKRELNMGKTRTVHNTIMRVHS